MRDLPHYSEPERTEAGTFSRLTRLEAKSDAMAVDVLAAWDGTKCSAPVSLRRRKWVGRTRGVTIFVALAAVIAATIAAIAWAPVEDAKGRRLDQFAAPGRWGPFGP